MIENQLLAQGSLQKERRKKKNPKSKHRPGGIEMSMLMTMMMMLAGEDAHAIKNSFVPWKECSNSLNLYVSLFFCFDCICFVNEWLSLLCNEKNISEISCGCHSIDLFLCSQNGRKEQTQTCCR